MSKDPEIIIKEADKGRGTVILNTKEYIYEVEHQLYDREYYLPLKGDPTDEIAGLLFCRKLSLDIIDMQTFQFLYKEYPRIPVFYILLKVHKQGFLPPGRTIVPANESLTEPLFHFVDYYLKPFVSQMSTYIKDTSHFITLIEDLIIPQVSVLVTMDIGALYTNIPLEEARNTAGLF